MRVVIVDGRNECSPDVAFYVGRMAIIEDWFVEKNILPHKCKEAVLLRATEKAMLFRCKDTEFWVPKSLIMFVDRKEKSLEEYEEYRKI